jgi:hypothetical protein
MPKDLTVTILAHVGTDPLSGKKEAMRYKVGDITQARLSVNVATKVGNDYILGGSGALSNPDVVYVHITDVPNAQAAKAGRLMEDERELTARGQPGGGDEGDYISRRLHKYRVEKQDIPAAARQALIDDGEITVTWTQAKPYIKKKVVIDEMDSTTDTEVILTDGDLS